jgi:hypothetical protein
MNVIAIHGLQDDRQTMVGALASALGVTAYEASTRLRAQGNALVVAMRAEHETALKLAESLRSAGFAAIVITEDDIENETRQFIVRKFDLGVQGLKVEALSQTLTVAYKDIKVILRGTAIASSTSTVTSEKRSLSLGRALLTSGLSMTKTTKTVQEVKTEQREGFFALYAEEYPALVFREGSLSYDSLGPARSASGAANFANLLSELRRRCPSARYDERLLSRAAQAALLGPSLRPEDHLAVATALLSKALGRGSRGE